MFGSEGMEWGKVGQVYEGQCPRCSGEAVKTALTITALFVPGYNLLAKRPDTFQTLPEAPKKPYGTGRGLQCSSKFL